MTGIQFWIQFGLQAALSVLSLLKINPANMNPTIHSILQGIDADLDILLGEDPTPAPPVPPTPPTQ